MVCGACRHKALLLGSKAEKTYFAAFFPSSCLAAKLARLGSRIPFLSFSVVMQQVHVTKPKLCVHKTHQNHLWTHLCEVLGTWNFCHLWTSRHMDMTWLLLKCDIYSRTRRHCTLLSPPRLYLMMKKLWLYVLSRNCWRCFSDLNLLSLKQLFWSYC